MRFHYRAKKGPGEHAEGEIEAVSQRAAVDLMIRQGLIPVEIRPVRQAAGQKEMLAAGSRVRDAVARIRETLFQADKVLFFRYLADFLSGDIPVLQAVKLTRRRFSSGVMASALEDMEDALTNGDALSEALSRHSGLFSELQVNMVRSGEAGGSLAATVGSLADFLEKDQETRSKVLGSFIYPAVIVFAGFVTVVVMLTVFIPRILGLLQEMDQSIPLLTRMLIGASDVLVHFWWLILIGAVAAVMLVVRWYRAPEGRLSADRRLLRAPGLGLFLREVMAARFARTLGCLLENGVDLVPALGFASGIVKNHYVRLQLAQAAQDVAGGMPLSAALARSDVFVESDISMISVGEETGRLSRALQKLAVFYDARNDRAVNVMIKMLEPVLIIGLGLVILVMILAMLMPIFQMNLSVR